MRKVYEQAEKVLVFDSILRSIHSRASAEEILLTMRLSPWSERLWTWHESVMAQCIFFQLREGAISGFELYRRYDTEFSSHPAVVTLASLMEDCDGPNGALCRALVRVMALSPDDALRDGRNPLTGPAKLINPAPDANEPSGCMLYNSGLNPWKRMESAGDDEHLAALISPGLATGTKRSSIPAMTDPRESTLVDLEPTNSEARADASIDGDQTPPAYHTVRLKGHFYRQEVTSSLPQAAFPRAWLANKPLSPSEGHLCQMIGRIVRVTAICRHWLKGFDLVFSAGGGRYVGLRATIRSIRATGLLESSPSDEADLVDFNQLVEVLSGISDRTTSWIEDEAICLSIALDLDPGKLYLSEPSKRIETLVSMWRSVPRTLLFIPGPRMEEQGLRWMPKSLLNCNERFLLPRGGNQSTKSAATKATRTEHGLFVQASGVFVKYSEMHETDDSHLLFLHNKEGDCIAIKKSVTLQQPGCGKLNDDMEYAIILEDVPRSRTPYKAVFVVVTKLENNVIFVGLLGHTVVTPLNEKEKDLILVHSRKLVTRKTAFMSTQQLWCVD